MSEEFTVNYTDSKYNLSIDKKYMNADGSIKKESEEIFHTWNDLQMKCIIPKCKESNLDFFGLYKHHKASHSLDGTTADTNEKFINCSESECGTLPELFSFSEFRIHVTSFHGKKNLRYW